MNLPYSAAAIGAVFLVLFILERGIPLRRSRRALAQRIVVNFAVSILALAMAFVAVEPSIEFALRGVASDRLGLLEWVELPGALRFSLGLLLLDLTFYYWHWANHRIPFLWRFHVAHHIDPDLDVTTAFRFHFGEVFLSAGFRVVQIVLLGPSPLIFASYELLFQLNTVFQHSNVRLPIGFERVLTRLLVTPRMHGIHHSVMREENSSNFSVVFPWWDWLHGTLILNVAQDRIEIGIAAYAEPSDNKTIRVLLLPLYRQRDYWRRRDGSVVTRDIGTDAQPVPVSYLER